MVRLGDRQYDLTSRALVMGILAPGPDRWADPSASGCLDTLLRRAEQLVSQGADVLEVGGPASPPGHATMTEAEELDGVVTMIAALHRRFDVALAVCTGRATRARAAQRAGAAAVIGNDQTGWVDPGCLAAAGAAGATVVVTHSALAPPAHDDEPSRCDAVAMVCESLAERARRAQAAGIAPDRIVLDPGLGVGKTAAQSLALLQGSDRLVALGFPVLVSPSDDAFLRQIVGLRIDERGAASLAAAALAVTLGCRIVRVHDVLGARRACDVLAAIGEAGSVRPELIGDRSRG